MGVRGYRELKRPANPQGERGNISLAAVINNINVNEQPNVQ